ncbi:hypothetical protein MCOR27_004344 [Pyricularia oryzae]|nr:hypothetical protein MCOR02_007332 [Pyricularia oryzae]KAI6281140.1 hypothetical protein MCOR27_004344 [Pyricularia oryzae]KAI6318256.1 hypothetical protein MCOR29_006003 [Pyricularia oryzae]KAI6375325.1 hypothetical protein MCOR31_002222 [Pyricularia oryzae]KAI6512427.1 hypothetical protein MCOR13_000226 [Pyricularia oryzae]
MYANVLPNPRTLSWSGMYRTCSLDLKFTSLLRKCASTRLFSQAAAEETRQSDDGMGCSRLRSLPQS